MNRFLTWFVVSSQNPEAFSMSLKGLLLANVGVIMFILHYLNMSVTVEQITTIIGAFTGFLGSAMLTAGLLRKLWLAIFPPKESDY